MRIGVVEPYASGGEMDDGTKVFDEMSRRDVIAWNLVIQGFCKHGMLNKMRRLLLRCCLSVVVWELSILGNGFTPMLNQMGFMERLCLWGRLVEYFNQFGIKVIPRKKCRFSECYLQK